MTPSQFWAWTLKKKKKKNWQLLFFLEYLVLKPIYQGALCTGSRGVELRHPPHSPVDACSSCTAGRVSPLGSQFSRPSWVGPVGFSSSPAKTAPLGTKSMTDFALSHQVVGYFVIKHSVTTTQRKVPSLSRKYKEWRMCLHSFWFCFCFKSSLNTQQLPFISH